MPTTKVYEVVTNDVYEFPVEIDLKGAKAVAKVLGISVQSVRHNLKRDSWKGRFKAVVLEEVDE